MDCSGQHERELVALHVDDLRDRQVDVAAIEQELRVDERDPDDVAVAVVADRVPFGAASTAGISDGEERTSASRS
jgi:hypothetical protein